MFKASKPEINNEVYDSQAHTWWQQAGFLQGLQALNPGRFAYLEQLLGEQNRWAKGMAVLDLGCGGGYASERMARMGMQVSGLDPSYKSIDAAKQHSAEVGLAINYKQGVGEHLPYDDAQFDLLFCCDVLEHVTDVEQVVKEIFRVLKPGGIFFFDTINRTAFSWLFLIKLAQDFKPTRIMPRNTHVWHMFIKPQELNEYLLKAGFAPQELVGFAPSLKPLALLKRVKASFDEGGQAQAGQSGLSMAARIQQQVEFGPSFFKQGLYMGWAKK